MRRNRPRDRQRCTNPGHAGHCRRAAGQVGLHGGVRRLRHLNRSCRAALGLGGHLIDGPSSRLALVCGRGTHPERRIQSAVHAISWHRRAVLLAICGGPDVRRHLRLVADAVVAESRAGARVLDHDSSPGARQCGRARSVSGAERTLGPGRHFCGNRRRAPRQRGRRSSAPAPGLDGDRRGNARRRTRAPPEIAHAAAAKPVPHGGRAVLCDHRQLLGLC